MGLGIRCVAFRVTTAPQQVMSTLNTLYSRLDDIILHEYPSLYKVETIGEAGKGRRSLWAWLREEPVVSHAGMETWANGGCTGLGQLVAFFSHQGCHLPHTGLSWLAPYLRHPSLDLCLIRTISLVPCADLHHPPLDSCLLCVTSLVLRADSCHQPGALC